jgi:hypothetical protein
MCSIGRSKESLDVSGVDLADRIVVAIDDEQVAVPVQKGRPQQVKDVRG